MMAAVGASEVITQLESAAKVLMVRTSSLFSPSAGAATHGRAVSGGFRCSETAAVVEVGHAFFSLFFFFWSNVPSFRWGKHR